MKNESLERRIAKLESLLMKNEAMSLPELEDAMEALSGLNSSNQLDNGNFRWSSAVNLLSSLMDSYDEDEMGDDMDAKDVARIKRNLEKAGYTSAADLVTEMITNVTKQNEKLKTAGKNLKEMLRIAKKFDKDYLA